MKKIVVLTGSYYPKASAVGNCIFNIVSELEKNFEIIVISNITSYGDKRESRLNNHDVIRFTTKELNRNVKVYKNSFISFIIKGMNKCKRLLRIYFSRYSVNKENIKCYVKELNQIKNIDLILCSCLPFETTLAALEYKQQCKRNLDIIPIFIDKFADSSTLHRSKINKKVKFKKNQYLEKKVIAESSKIFYINSWKNYLEEYFSEYMDKYIEIELPLIKNNTMPPSLKVRDNIKIYYTGALLENYVDLDYFSKLLSNNFYIKDQFEFYFYVNENGRKMIKKLLDENIKCYIENWTPQYELERIIQDASIFLSISEKRGIQLSSKIFTYISTGKPIVHIYYQDEDVNLQYLKEYPLCLLLNVKNSFEYNKQLFINWTKENNNKVLDYTIIRRKFNEFTGAVVADKIRDYL